MSANRLCGLDPYCDGPYTAEGIKAIASAISVSASLTSINISRNMFGDEGAKHLASAISVSASLTSIDLSWNKIGYEGAKHVAKGISVSASLTSIDLCHNGLGSNAKAELRYAVRNRAGFQLDL